MNFHCEITHSACSRKTCPHYDKENEFCPSLKKQFMKNVQKLQLETVIQEQVDRAYIIAESFKCKRYHPNFWKTGLCSAEPFCRIFDECRAAQKASHLLTSILMGQKLVVRANVGADRSGGWSIKV